LKKLITTTIILIFIIITTLLYARFIGIKGLTVREYKITNENFISEYYGTKIIHFSDIHYGKTTFKKDIDYMVEKINELKPDIVVFTGDLIDKSTNLTDEIKNDLINSLSKIKANLGKYAIAGEDDLNLEDYETIIKKANFVYLNNSYDLIYADKDPILIAQINDNLNLEGINAIYNILLIHNPNDLENIKDSRFNLILAGHTHNGQIKLPILKPLLLDKNTKYYKDYYKLNNSKLYISGGIGTSKYKLRLNVKPSINLYRLTNK